METVKYYGLNFKVATYLLLHFALPKQKSRHDHVSRTNLKEQKRQVA